MFSDYLFTLTIIIFVIIRDHCIFVGLEKSQLRYCRLYPAGYFRQYLKPDGVRFAHITEAMPKVTAEEERVGAAPTKAQGRSVQISWFLDKKLFLI